MHGRICRIFPSAIAAEESSVGVTSTLNLHDLQRDLIHKRREKVLPGLHLRLVEAWGRATETSGYLCVALDCVSLGEGVKADRKGDLRRLLFDFNYLQTKLSKTNPNTLIGDYVYLPEDKNLRTVQSVLRQSAHILARSPRELPGQLVGRLPRRYPGLQVKAGCQGASSALVHSED